MGTRRAGADTPQDVFRDRLRDLRTDRGLSQQQLAEKVAQLGGHVPRVTITRLESGPREVTLDELLSLAAALSVSPLMLLLPVDETSQMRLGSQTLTTREVASWYLGGWAGERPELLGLRATSIPGALHGVIRSRAPGELRMLADFEEDGSDKQKLLLEAAAHAEWLLRKHRAPVKTIPTKGGRRRG
jgi:transcriptional regulator with XRE-family HTH domain